MRDYRLMAGDVVDLRCWMQRWSVKAFHFCCAQRCGQGRWSGHPFSGPRSRADIAVRAGYRVNTTLGRSFCGNREWGLRPDTQTTCPTAVLACDGWRAQIVSKVGGGACRRRLHSRLPARAHTANGVNAGAAANPKASPRA